MLGKEKITIWTLGLVYIFHERDKVRVNLFGDIYWELRRFFKFLFCNDLDNLVKCNRCDHYHKPRHDSPYCNRCVK